MIRKNLRMLLFGGMSATLAVLSFAVSAQESGASAPRPALSRGTWFVEKSGEELFANVCQGCHMPGAEGAVGAGIYPPLAGNSSLAAGAYPVDVVVNGQRGMPALGAMMSDDQVVAVVNFLRTHFGNDYRDVITVEDVKLVRRQK